MEFNFFNRECRILKIENGVIGEDWYCDYGLIELKFLKRNLKCKFIKIDALRLH
jgi:hypothetical protein